jgi:hypothetical protein
MPEVALSVGSFVLVVLMVLILMKAIPRAVGNQCPKCLRRVPKGKTICPACGTGVNARTDLGK